MKYIPYFWYTLSLLSFGSCFVLMANSTEPVYFIVLGIVSSLSLATFGMLSQSIVDTSKRVRMHTEALKYLTKQSRSK